MFRDDVTLAEDGDVYAFVLPPVDPLIEDSVVASGDFVVAFSDRPEVQYAQTYLSSPEWVANNIALGGSSAHTGVPLDAYDDPISRLSAQILTEPGATIRFDASDLMPVAVQAEEWRQLTKWFAEGKPTRAVLRAVDDAWPSARS